MAHKADWSRAGCMQVARPSVGDSHIQKRRPIIKFGIIYPRRVCWLRECSRTHPSRTDDDVYARASSSTLTPTGLQTISTYRVSEWEATAAARSLERWICRNTSAAAPAARLICSLVQIDAKCWLARAREMWMWAAFLWRTQYAFAFFAAEWCRSAWCERAHTIELQNDLWSGDKHLLTDAVYFSQNWQYGWHLCN